MGGKWGLWRWLPPVAAAIAVAACNSTAREHGELVQGKPSPPAPSAPPHARPAHAPAVLAALERARPVAALTMRDALHRAFRHSPVLHAAKAETAAKRSEAFQAGRGTNPELDVEIENFAGTGELAGFDSAETTVSLTKVVELGHKRLKRLTVAELDADVAQRDYEAARLKVAGQTLQAFVDVLAGQLRTGIHKEFVRLTERLSSTVGERVKAGKVSGVEANKADVELARSRLELQEEEARLQVARQRLALSWGAHAPDFSYAAGELATTNHLPPAYRFKAYLDGNPNLTRWAAELDRRSAALSLEQAKRIPDLRLGAGVRRFEETDDTALVATLSLGLPFFDRNRGNIDAARARLEKGRYEREATNTVLVGSFVEAYGSLKAAEVKLRALDQKVLPAARAAFEAMERGYREGKFDLLNVLDARKSLIQARLDIINTRAEFHKAKAAIEALIGRDLYSIR